MPWIEAMSSAVKGVQEQGQGGWTGTVQRRVDWSSAVEGGEEQCTGGSTEHMHWMYVWKSALEEHWNSVVEGRLESHGGRNGPVYWSENWGSLVEGTLEQGLGGRPGKGR